jgi:tetrahydrodipicolinate N-succinyltransferase
MINRAYGLRLDHVGKIDIGSDVFIGYRAVVMPGVSIGNKVIVGAGAIVTHDIPPNSVVVGVPARRVCSLDELVERLKHANQGLPWRRIIEKRIGSFDATLEPELERLRVRHFYGDSRR